MKTRLSGRVVLLALAATLVLPATPAWAHDGHEHSSPAPSTPKRVGFDLLGQVNPGAGTNADVFAFNGFAYLGSWVGKGCLSNGIRVYDLHDPWHPTQVSTFADAASNPALAGTWTEKVIVRRVHTRSFHGVLAAVSFQACSSANAQAFRGFGVYDVTDPRHPRELSRYAAPGTRGSHEIWLGSDGGRAFVYTAIINSELTTSPTFDPATGDATVPGRADFRIVDVSDPRRPRDAGEWGAWKELGVKPNADDKSNFVHSVRVDENLRRAVLSYWDLGTILLDISNPRHPRFLGKTTPTQGATHSSYVTRGGTVLVETHETEAGLPVYYDISRPSQPRQLATFRIDGFENDTVHDPKVRGNTTFFSWYSLGVVAANSARPSQPALRAQFVPDTDYINPDFFCTEPCAQVWGVALDGGLVLASDMNSGLYVLRLR